MKSFANGNGQALGNGAGEPYWTAHLQGWDIRPWSHWDFTEPRLPA